MKKLVLMVAILFVSSMAKTYAQVIDMESFEQYLTALNYTKSSNENLKAREVKRICGNKYDRGKIKAKANGKTLDRESCAYLAAYYENDYDQHKKKSDLKAAVKYYQKALYNRDSKNRVLDEVLAQVKYRYGVLLLKNMRTDDIVDVLDLDGNYTRTMGEVQMEASNYIFEAAENGSKPAAYVTARIHRGLEAPNPSCDMAYYLFNKQYYRDLKTCEEFHRLNKSVEEYYAIAAKDGQPMVQMEFADYLLNSVCIWSTPKHYGYVLNYKADARCLDGMGEVFDVDLDYADGLVNQAVYLYGQAAQQNNPVGMVNYAFYLLKQAWANEVDKEAILHWLNKAAQMGNTIAMYNLSVLKMNELGVYKDFEDKTDAFMWAKRGAEMDDFACQHLLGRYYYYGKGTEINMTEALKWFRKAADNGSTGASYMAGKLYADKSVGNDMKKAVECFEKATNILEAYQSLIECYKSGNGVFMDYNRAREYEEMLDGINTFPYYDIVDYTSFRPEMCYYKVKFVGTSAAVQDGKWEWEMLIHGFKQL